MKTKELTDLLTFLGATNVAAILKKKEITTILNELLRQKILTMIPLKSGYKEICEALEHICPSIPAFTPADLEGLDALEAIAHIMPNETNGKILYILGKYYYSQEICVIGMVDKDKLEALGWLFVPFELYFCTVAIQQVTVYLTKYFESKENGQPEQAEEYYRRGITLDEDLMNRCIQAREERDQEYLAATQTPEHIAYADPNEAINNHPEGHLPLANRIALMQEIGKPATVNKIFFECAKKVFPIWEAEYPGNTPVYQMLAKAHNYLYRKKGKKADFEQLAEENRNYLEGMNSEAGAAGLVALSLCYNIAFDAAMILDKEDYNGTDDDTEFDYDEWTPDFYASMAYSEGSPFDGDIDKRREFWHWFLNTTTAISKHPDTPVIPFVEKTFQKLESIKRERTQSYKTPAIQEKIAYCIQTTTRLLAEQNIQWHQFALKGRCMKGGNNYKTYIIQDNIETQFHGGDLDIIQSLADIKKEMYCQVPEEGAWCQCCLTVDHNNEYVFSFNYDEESGFPENDLSPGNIQYEFKAFPRSKEFTPEWWQQILGKKAKYLTTPKVQGRRSQQ